MQDLLYFLWHAGCFRCCMQALDNILYCLFLAAKIYCVNTKFVTLICYFLSTSWLIMYLRKTWHQSWKESSNLQLTKPQMYWVLNLPLSLTSCLIFPSNAFPSHLFSLLDSAYILPLRWLLRIQTSELASSELIQHLLPLQLIWNFSSANLVFFFFSFVCGRQHGLTWPSSIMWPFAPARL